MGKRLVAGIALALAVFAFAVFAFALGARSSDGDAAGETAARAETQPEAGAVAGSVALSDVAFDAGVPARTAALDSAAPDVAAPVEAARADAGAEVEPELVSSVADHPGDRSEGIQVHGQWTLEITEPDGRLVSRTEFDNALVDGAAVLSRVLARATIPARWAVNLGEHNSLSASPCLQIGGTPTRCVLNELPVDDPLAVNNQYIHGGLELSSPSTGPNEDALVLSGSVTAGRDSNIEVVRTILSECASSNAAEDGLTCAELPGLPTTFSEKTLNSAVPVLEDQVVNVTVVFTFS